MVILALGVTASAEWNEKVLYSFQGGTDGQLPVGSIVFDSAGNLYGATTQGGATNCSPLADCGTVFQLTPPPKQGDPWTETVLYTFKGAKYGDGDEPAGGLLIDSQGNLYGTTAYGGTGDCVLLGVEGGCGTVFELSPPSEKGGAWTETILYSFPTAKQGYLPNGDLVFDSAGNLYGATQYGGGKGTTCDRFYQYCGAVFELSPPKAKGGKWTEEVLHAFAGGTDGANPNGGLVLNGNGAVYGTTNSGGNQSCQYEGQIGCGTAFELKPPTKKGGGWSEAVLHHFDRTSSDGGNPMAGMVFDAKSRLYGITLNGGPGGGGVVFRLSLSKKPGSWTEAILYGFNGDTGGYDPEGALIFDASGNLYGTTNVGRGGSLRGNVFQLKQPSGKDRAWTLSTIHGFTGIPDGENPTSRLTSDKAGNLYSTT
jgi:uncharacterized repeat protein (TIGR03803 family)